MDGFGDKHALFRKLFSDFDLDGDDTITREELLAKARGPLGKAIVEAFDALDKNADGRLTWGDVESFLSSSPVALGDELGADGLFALIDRDGSGTISAQELLLVLTSLDDKLTLRDAQDLVREFDRDGNGTIDIGEFVGLIEKLRSHPPAATTDVRPHIVLNMDVNNTVIMFDSATGADARALISMVLANSAWGTIDEKGERWTPVSTEPSVVAPRRGLSTYTSFVLHHVELSGDIRERRNQQRQRLREFVSAGQPGECFLPHSQRLMEALQLPEALAGSELARAAGLDGKNVLLLPSFLRLLHRLASEGRSFTVVFRTFGHDLGMLAKEYNAFWEAQHPLFPLRGQAGAVVGDGSDGSPDMRMRLPSVDGCGTFHRTGTGVGEENLVLIMGTIDQPEHATIEGRRSYEARIEAGDPIRLVRGGAAIAQYLGEQTRRPQTLALRDFYRGWEMATCTAPGGKPLLIEEAAQDVLQIFFDDHILPSDAKIVCAHPTTEDTPMLPIAAIYGSHLIRAEPLRSIGEPDYFYDAVMDAESRWRQRGALRQTLARALSDLAHLRRALGVVSASGTTKELDYTPYQQSDTVLLASSDATFEDVL